MLENVSKHCFFKKKAPRPGKQKTFVLLCAGLLPHRWPKLIKGFLLPRAGRGFFKKEVLPFLPSRAPGANHPHVTMCDAEL
jgi:hypothetical protein